MKPYQEIAIGRRYMDNATQDPTHLLEQLLAQASPRQRLLMQLLSRSTAEQQDQDDERRQRTEMRRYKLRLMLAENRMMRARIAALAAALGSCECFGQDEDCECGGTEGPGSMLPDPLLFREYVRPCLDALRAARKPTQPPAQPKE